MSTPITGKIDVKKIAKEHLFTGTKGTYLDIVIWENKDGPDQYGNTHMICQGVSKAAREAGAKGPIIGNLKIPEAMPERPAKPPTAEPLPDDDTDLPF